MSEQTSIPTEGRMLPPWEPIGEHNGCMDWRCRECKATVSRGSYPTHLSHKNDCSYSAWPIIERAEKAEVENVALRNLANNLQPGPISVALGGAEHEKPFRLAAGFVPEPPGSRFGAWDTGGICSCTGQIADTGHIPTYCAHGNSVQQREFKASPREPAPVVADGMTAIDAIRAVATWSVPDATYSITANGARELLAALDKQPGEPAGDLQANYLANLTAKAETVALCDELTYCLRELRNVLNSDNLKPFYVRLRTRIDAVLERASGRGHFQTPTEFGSPLTKPTTP